jgi:hypothetical protein
MEEKPITGTATSNEVQKEENAYSKASFITLRYIDQGSWTFLIDNTARPNQGSPLLHGRISSYIGSRQPKTVAAERSSQPSTLDQWPMTSMSMGNPQLSPLPAHDTLLAKTCAPCMLTRARRMP